MRNRRILAMFTVLFLPVVAGAACFDEAGARYGIDPRILIAISQVESNGKATAINRNGNGSYDYGHMQINSWWFPKLAEHGLDRRSLADPCTSTYVGAWILAQNIRQYGYSWEAIGAYNASSPQKRAVYARKIAAALEAYATR